MNREPHDALLTNRLGSNFVPLVTRTAPRAGLRVNVIPNNNRVYIVRSSFESTRRSRA